MADAREPGAPRAADLAAALAAIAGRDRMPLDVRLADLGVDSADLLEWLYLVEDLLAVDLDPLLDRLDDGDRDGDVSSFGDSTLGELIAAVMAAPARENVG
jgi:hypothetical protein